MSKLGQISHQGYDLIRCASVPELAVRRPALLPWFGISAPGRDAAARANTAGPNSAATTADRATTGFGMFDAAGRANTSDPGSINQCYSKILRLPPWVACHSRNPSTGTIHRPLAVATQVSSLVPSSQHYRCRCSIGPRQGGAISDNLKVF